VTIHDALKTLQHVVTKGSSQAVRRMHVDMQMPAAAAFFTGRRLGAPAIRQQPRLGARRQVTVEAKGKKVMIVNTKKGGHAFLGLYLAKRLLGKGYSVTIFNDGDSVSFSPLLACVPPHAR
jgi:hypothetical protein